MRRGGRVWAAPGLRAGSKGGPGRTPESEQVARAGAGHGSPLHTQARPGLLRALTRCGPLDGRRLRALHHHGRLQLPLVVLQGAVASSGPAAGVQARPGSTACSAAWQRCSLPPGSPFPRVVRCGSCCCCSTCCCQSCRCCKGAHLERVHNVQQRPALVLLRHQHLVVPLVLLRSAARRRSRVQRGGEGGGTPRRPGL